MPRLDTSTVVAMALAESGETHELETIERWLDGSEVPPPRITAIVEGILANLDYHLRIAQSRMLVDDEVNDDALRGSHPFRGRTASARPKLKRTSGGARSGCT